MNERDTNSIQLTPQVAALLFVLSRRFPLDSAELERELAAFIVFGDETVESICTYAEKQDLILKRTGGWALSEWGTKVLEAQTAEQGAEAEDIGSADHPLKPYDVAKLKVEQKPLSVFQALRKIEKKEIFLDPEFQRAFVWDEVRQSRLIESILIRIPLPAFYLDATDEVKWSVVDGLQRLTTLYRFCRGSSFPLTGLEFLAELSGLRFDELPQKYRVLIEDDTQLIFNNLLPGTPVKAKFTIFSRVNTGGMLLNAQEIRHALQQGKVTPLLRTLTNSIEFLQSTGGALESLRMIDREVTLRAISFMEFGPDRYREFNDLNAFLVDSMERFNSSFSDEELERIGNDFKHALRKVHAVFGRYAFRKYYANGGRRGPFNKALFEAWISAVVPYSEEFLLSRRDDIRAEFLEAINLDEDFVRSITTSTGQTIAVRTRFLRVAQILKKATA